MILILSEDDMPPYVLLEELRRLVDECDDMNIDDRNKAEALISALDRSIGNLFKMISGK